MYGEWFFFNKECINIEILKISDVENIDENDENILERRARIDQNSVHNLPRRFISKGT